MVLDSLGRCWIATNRGLFLYDGTWLNRQGDWEGYEGGGVQALALRGQSELWVASDSGLYVGKDRFQRHPGRLPATAKVRALAFWRGEALLASSEGLFWLNGQQPRVLLSGIDVLALAVTEEGEIYAGSRKEGLYHLDRRGNPGGGLPAAVSRLETVDALCLGREGLFLLGASAREGRLLMRLADERIEDMSALLQDPGAQGTPVLMRLPQGAALYQNGAWRLLEGEGGRLEAGGLGLQWPLEDPLAWLPTLFLQSLPGRLSPVDERHGLLLSGSEGPSLLPLGGGIPLQLLERRTVQGRERLLLVEQEEGRRLFIDADGKGFRPLPLPAQAGSGPANSLCWLPGKNSEQVLVAFADRLMSVDAQGRWSRQADRGARWLEPLSREQILVGGDEGLALFDGENWQAMDIQEPVFRFARNGQRELVAHCRDYLLRLDAFNELDTLDLPAGRKGELRQLLLSPRGRVWLLDEGGLHLQGGRDGPWGRPLGKGESLPSSMAFDGGEGVWLSGLAGTARLGEDSWPPLLHLQQDPDRLDLSRPLELKLLVADPFSPRARPLLRYRVNEGAWSSWQEEPRIFFPRGGGEGLRKGANRLQLQARDDWGNLGEPSALTLFLPEDAGRIRLARKAALLVSLVALVLALTLVWPGRTSLVLTLALGFGCSAWIFLRTEEPYLWMVLPLLLLLIRKSTRLYRVPEEEGTAPRGNPLYELVDLFREFGHSGVATRNLDRLLRSARNLYLDGQTDPEVLGRYQGARELFLETTAGQVLEILQAFRRLPEEQNPVAPILLRQAQDRVRKLLDLLKGAELPTAALCEELALELSALERQLDRLERAIDRQVATRPTRVLDGLLRQKREELAGVALELHIPSDLREMGIRLPAGQLQFILENLISNALYWMKDCEQPVLSLELRERPTRLQVLVKDNGAGIDPADHERVFEAGRSGREGEGGYGLYRSREILARFGGRLVVHESAKGDGATFLLEAKKVELGE